MTAVRAFLATAAAAVALAAPAAASADTQDVNIAFAGFSPPHISVLAGDTVAWHNTSFRDHTVTGTAGDFGSPGHVRALGGSYSFQFSAVGSHPYYCQLHPFMTGEVDVFPVLLNGPTVAVSRGAQVPLDGRADPGTSAVEIQQDTGSGFGTVATAGVDSAGHFAASLPATTSAAYRALSPAGPSPAVQVAVIDRKLEVRASRHGGSALVRVRAVPPDPGGIVMLQLQLRERFGWWPAARSKLDRHSRAVFRAPRGARARVVLTLDDGWTPVFTTPARRLPK